MLSMSESLWVWGISDAGKVAVRYFDSIGVHIKGIIDNDKSLFRRIYHGYQIYDFQTLKPQISRDDIVLCCCSLSVYEEIKKELERIGHKKYIHFYDVDFTNAIYSLTDDVASGGTLSRLCSVKDFEDKNFQRISQEFGWDSLEIKYRKVWEWGYIVEVLDHYGMLRNGKKGLGFAVGTEPLPSYFASKGVDVLATDLSADNQNAGGWAASNANALGDMNKMWHPEVCTKEQFDSHVSYRDIDMNYIPAEESEYDFCWSSCAIEHVGSLELSKTFLKNMLSTLKSGGVAVHTTEFNLSSNEDTIKTGDSVIFRRRDLEEMRDWFVSQGHLMALSFGREKTEGNSYIDIPPFKSEFKPYHLTLVANGFIETSFGIVVVKDGLK